jgi:hypothetical protein
MTCRCCCRMPADGSRKKDYRAGPCQMPPARDPSDGLKHNVAGHSGSKLHRLHLQYCSTVLSARPARPAPRAPVKLTRPLLSFPAATPLRLSAPAPLRPHQHSPALALEDSTSRLPVRKLRSNGYSMLPPALLMFGPDGSSRTPALNTRASCTACCHARRETKRAAGEHDTVLNGEGRGVERSGW